MEWKGMDSGTSSLVAISRPITNALSVPVFGWAIDKFQLCPVIVSNLSIIANSVVFFAWPFVLGEYPILVMWQSLYLYFFRSQRIRLASLCLGDLWSGKLFRGPPKCNGTTLCGEEECQKWLRHPPSLCWHWIPCDSLCEWLPCQFIWLGYEWHLSIGWYNLRLHVNCILGAEMLCVKATQA